MSELKAVETMEEGSCLCPECGWTGGKAPHRKLWHWTRSGPIALAAGAFVALVMWLMLTAGTAKVSSGSMVPRFATPGFTEAQIKAIADGTSSDGELAQEVLKAALASVYWRDVERYGVAVAFLDTKGQRSSSIRRGWPIPWMWISTSDSYDDLLRRSGRKIAVTDPTAPPVGRWAMPSNPLLIPVRPTFEWHGFIVTYHPPPEKTAGSYVSGRIYPALLLLIPLATCVVLWYVMLAGVGLSALFGLKLGKLRNSKVRLIIVALVGFAFLVLELAYVKSIETQPWSRSFTTKQIGKPPAFTYSTRQEFRRLNVSLD